MTETKIDKIINFGMVLFKFSFFFFFKKELYLDQDHVMPSKLCLFRIFHQETRISHCIHVNSYKDLRQF